MKFVNFFTIISLISFISHFSQCQSLFSLEEHSDVINSNHTEYTTLCDEGDELKCYEKSVKAISTYDFISHETLSQIDDLDEREDKIYHNNVLSDYWYYAGLIEYWGLIKKKPNLAESFAKFLIASYFGNPKAMYKLYIIIETDLLKLIIDSKEYENVKENSISSKYLKFIMNKNNTNYSSNFYYEDESEKNSIALQFLYSSALYKHQPAMTTLAYKLFKGYGVGRSCEASLKYYKQTSSNNVRDITNRRKPNYYEKVNIATYEYIGHKFSSEILDIDDIIDYFKVEAQNGQINYIQQLGQRYLYGQGIAQDFNQAFYYFDLGARMNDSVCIYYLGEMYLNGWGVEKNYSEAFKLFSHAMTLNNHKSWNALGYMYYYGLGVEKNINRAYDYFKISFSKGEESDAYYNMVTLLIEGNEKIQVDFPNAYKYANFIAAKGHTFGTHMFGMLNEYQLGAIVKTCEITIEFFKQVAERNLSAKRKFDLAMKLYREGFYKISALIYMELAEEGFEFGQVNAGLILKNYDVFINSNYNKFLSYKYMKMAYKSKNIFATLTLADYYHFGLGELPVNYTKAIKLYRKVIQSGNENSFYIAHAYFNLGTMNQLANGLEKNMTKAMRFYNLSSEHEPNAFYPSLVMKYFIQYESSNFTQMILNHFISIYAKVTTPGPILYGIFSFIFLYICFFLSLKFQKE